MKAVLHQFRYGWIICKVKDKGFQADCTTLVITVEADTLEELLQKMEEAERERW